MNSESPFGAPWCNMLKVTTSFCLIVCLGVPLAVAIRSPHLNSMAHWIVVAVPPLILLGCAPFVVRGYSLSENTLSIHRLGWTMRFDLAGLTSAAIEPEAMKWSVRLFGIGGLFVFCGLFWSKKLGRYRAYITDPKRAVVLRFGKRVIVVTPDQPQRFLSEINSLKPALS